MVRFSRALELFLIMFLVVGCFSTPSSPTSVIAQTSPEAQNIDYWQGLNVSLARLKRDVGSIEESGENAPLAFTIGVSVHTTISSIERLPVPTGNDSSDVTLSHRRLLTILEPCKRLGILAMDAESVPLSELQVANALCGSAFAVLEKDEMYSDLFECPENEPCR